MSQYKYIIPEELSSQRLDKALSMLMEKISRSRIQRAIKEDKLTVNSKITSDLATKVKYNDVLVINIEDEVLKEILPKNIPLDILYEDDHIIVLNKNANMTVHPGAGDYENTLVNALLYHTDSLSDVRGDDRPGIVHRLDKNTTGLMVIAKDNQSHISLAKQILNKSFIRKYEALVWGMVQPLNGRIDIATGRSLLDRKKMSVRKSGGKEAITHYKTMDILCNNLFSLVECRLETGRTHQIRVHLSHIGHSIVGDPTYGNNKRKIQNCPEEIREELLGVESQMLHSFYMSFTHPVTQQQMEFIQDIPQNYKKLIEHIKGSS